MSLIKKTAITALMAAAGLAMSQGALAQGMRGGQDSGWYVGGSIGQTSVDISCAGASSCDDSDTAFKVFGGYQINRNFAVEFGYTDLGTFKASAPGLSLDIDTNAWELVGVGAYPFSPQFSVYGKLGFYRGEAKASATLGVLSGSAKETNTDLTYGVGLQYNLNRQLGVRGEWQRYSSMGGDSIGGEFDVDVLSLGLTYKF